ncbi:MAG: hypothetical protein HY298_10920 [Verrucomicrobia bacterium]|nr:hypothetical protein [Verrucomicrobiota bacterium]
MKKDPLIRRPQWPCRARGVAAVVALLLANAAAGQEAIRASMAGQDAAEARKRALREGHFNLRLGPVSLRLQSSMGMEATDNVRLVDSNPQTDLIFRPQVSTMLFWPVTEKNSLNLSLGVGYSKYLKTTEFDNLFISPGSDLSFDVFIRDFAINFHDRFSYSQDVANDPTVSGTGSLNRFENVGGIQVVWDLNKAVLSAGYDHSIYLAEASQFTGQSHASDLFNASAGVVINPLVLVGLQVGGGFTTYDEKTFNNSKHAAIGPFLNAQLSEYSSVRLTVGYVAYFIERTANTNIFGTNAVSDVNAFYGDLTFRQRVNANFAHSLAIGRQVTAGSFSDTVDLYYARYSVDWRLFQKTSLGPSLSYEHGTEAGGLGEKLDRYGLGLALGRGLTQHLSGGLRYQFYRKDAQPKSRSYVENRLVLNLIYAF